MTKATGRPTLEQRISRLEVGWMEAARITGRLQKEIRLLQANVRQCDTSLGSILLLVGGLEEVFSATSDSVASG